MSEAYVYVRLTRPEGYEDVHPSLVIEDAIPSGDWSAADVTGEIDRLRAALAEAQRENASLALTVKALTPAANYCLEYKPLLLAAEAEVGRLREAVKEWVPALREACARVVVPEKTNPWMWLALLGEARDAADALDAALAPAASGKGEGE